MDIERIARACHEMNRLYCQLLGDDSQKPWEDAEQWQKHSVIEGVRAVLKGTSTPEDSHAGWMEHKIKDGWKYGKVKDTEAKTHPCLVPYDELSTADKARDEIFLAVVKGMAG